MASEPVVFSDNPSFDLAERFVNHTARHVFLTGKAGTGKTTFLKKISASTAKNTVVVAPTGVAAINAGGTTIHSFFQLPFSPFVPRARNPFDRRDIHPLLQNMKIESQKRKLFRELDLLIIDEVSMVRCDVLDAIDLVLRHFRRKEHLPFGGVQVLFIGDLFQLPPVVQRPEWEILQGFYEGPFFFQSHVIREVRPLYIELKKIYRQRDEEFINLLNRVRSNEVTDSDLDRLNSRFAPLFEPDEGEKYITLTTHNLKADKINSDELEKLPGELHTFEAAVEGDFSERAFPTERKLLLKVGAQVMFIKNDPERERRYFNGKIATVLRITNESVVVSFADDGSELEVEKDTWRNVRYNFDSDSRAIEEEIIGTFTQYPLRLAWAVTIHKSQGLTFERAIIDAGSSFAPGQVYVALSRCTTMEGIVLKSRIQRHAVTTDHRVLAFAANEVEVSTLGPLLASEQKKVLVDNLMKVFDFSIVLEELDIFLEKGADAVDPNVVEAVALLTICRDRLAEHQEMCIRFSSQLNQLLLSEDFTTIQARISKAVIYFNEDVGTRVLSPLREFLESLKSRKKVRKLTRRVKELIEFLQKFVEVMKRADGLAEEIERKKRVENGAFPAA